MQRIEASVDFFVLDSIVGSVCETEFEKVEPIHRGEADKCPICGMGFVSMLPWRPPFRAAIRVWGKEIADLITGPGDELLVSKRFRDGWIARGLKAAESFSPVEVVRITPKKFRRPDTEYFCLRPRVGRTTIDFARTKIEWSHEPPCLYCGKGAVHHSLTGFAIDETTWTGEDLFFPLGLTGSRVFSARVRDMAQELGLHMPNFVPVEKDIWPPPSTLTN